MIFVKESKKKKNTISVNRLQKKHDFHQKIAKEMLFSSKDKKKIHSHSKDYQNDMVFVKELQNRHDLHKRVLKKMLFL